MNTLNIVALVLVIVGGLNWGLVGAADFNLVTALFGAVPALENAVYLLVGVAALYCLTLLKHFLPAGKASK